MYICVVNGLLPRARGASEEEPWTASHWLRTFGALAPVLEDLRPSRTPVL